MERGLVAAVTAEVERGLAAAVTAEVERGRAAAVTAEVGRGPAAGGRVKAAASQVGLVVVEAKEVDLVQHTSHHQSWPPRRSCLRSEACTRTSGRSTWPRRAPSRLSPADRG